MKFVTIFFFFLCTIIYSSQAQRVSVDSLLIQINELEQSNDFKKAKELIKISLNDYEENWFKLSKELIYCNKKLGLYEDNLAIFKEAHQKGYFYFIHPAMPAYAPYKEFAGFDSISKRDIQLLREANTNSKTIYDVGLPTTYSDSNTYPLIFLMHGGGRNLQSVKEHWNSDTLKNNYIKVFVQSYRHFDSENYGWSNSDERLDTDFQSILDTITQKYSIDSAAIFIGSISAGAVVAIDLALRAVIPVKGTIAYCPGLPVILKNKAFDSVKNRNVKIFIAAGEKDHFRPRQETMIHIFDSLKIDYQYIILDSLGHEYPKDENFYIQKGLDFITR